MGWHATGMPIKAVADKLKNEVAWFGRDFEGYKEDEVVVDEKPTDAKEAREDITKFSTKKSKANAKTIKAKYQVCIGYLGSMLHVTDRQTVPNHGGHGHPKTRDSPLCRRIILAGLLPPSGSGGSHKPWLQNRSVASRMVIAMTLANRYQTGVDHSSPPRLTPTLMPSFAGR